MSVIGDALGRAERDHRTDPIRDAATPSRSVTVPPSEAAETQLKGIARPQQSMIDGGRWFSSILMTLFVAVIGFAGYITIYPEWVDSLWKFPSTATQVATTNSNEATTPHETPMAPPIERITPAMSLAATAPACPTIALQTPEQLIASIEVPKPLQPALPVASPDASAEVQPSAVTKPKIEPKPHTQPAPKVESAAKANPVVENLAKPTPRKAKQPKTKQPKAKQRQGRRIPRKQARPTPTRSITKIPVRTTDLKSRFSVDGVMLGGERKTAVINGEIVGVDDEVDGAIVRAITGSGVAIEVDGRIRRVPVSAEQSPENQNESGGGVEFND
ncbi:MAG: hypothetical protein DHS20C16_15190 [Phycisphaerae bacterium]|nr:MAG: hypothetical protein DHS20C16_15190 [Phycisphaerae bacterium]